MSADEEIMVIMSEAAETEGLELRPKNGGPNRRRRGPRIFAGTAKIRGPRAEAPEGGAKFRG